MWTSDIGSVFFFVVPLVLLALTLFVLWHVIRSAVLSALRQHRAQVQLASGPDDVRGLPTDLP